MTQERAKELLPVITHWANGGVLWGYSSNCRWFKYKPYNNINFRSDGLYVIEDQFIEERKAFAVGKDILMRPRGGRFWRPISEPSFNPDFEYKVVGGVEPTTLKQAIYNWFRLW